MDFWLWPSCCRFEVDLMPTKGRPHAPRPTVHVSRTAGQRGDARPPTQPRTAAALAVVPSGLWRAAAAAAPTRPASVPVSAGTTLICRTKESVA